jgi:hypothetical protein
MTHYDALGLQPPLNAQVTELPLKPPLDPPKRRTLAPAWLSFACAWLGLLNLALSLALPFVPGSKDPRAELTHARPYSLADWLLLIAIYLCPLTITLSLIVIRQMATEPRPLPDALRLQRLQAFTGIALALLSAVILYTFVALRGPSAAS